MKTSSVLFSLLAALAGLALVVGLFSFTGITLTHFDALRVQFRFWPFAGIVICSLLYVILGAIKWHLIAGVSSPRKFFYTYYTAQAMLIGQFLPPPVAVAASRAAVMKIKQNVALKKGLLNALYDMGFDFLIAVLLVPATLLQLLYRFDFRVWLGLSLFILAGASLVFMYAPKILLLFWRAPVLIDHKKHGMLSSRLIGLMMLLSATRFVTVIVRLALGAAAIGAIIPYTTIAYVTPPATLPSLLALTPANLGVAEWSWAYLLALWGVPAAIGAFYAISFRILVLMAQAIVSALCWLVYTAANRR